MFRKLYRSLLPYPLRRIIYPIYRLWRSISADYVPRSSLFNPTTYDEYWQSRQDRAKDELATQLSYRDLIEACVVAIPAGSRVLDFGCGTGELLAQIAQRQSIQPYGIDLSAAAVEITRAKGIPAEQLMVNDVNDLHPLGNFDVVLCTEVIEHIPQAELILLALAQVSVTLLISIPNTGYFISRLRLLFGRFPHQWHEHPAEHLRYWTRHDFTYMTTHLFHFEVRQVIGIGGGAAGKWFPGLFAPSLLFMLHVPKREVP